MRIRMTTGTRVGLHTFGLNGQPLTLISRHYPKKPKSHKTKEEIEQDSRVDATYRR